MSAVTVRVLQYERPMFGGVKSGQYLPTVVLLVHVGCFKWSTQSLHIYLKNQLKQGKIVLLPPLLWVKRKYFYWMVCVFFVMNAIKLSCLVSIDLSDQYVGCVFHLALHIKLRNQSKQGKML